MTQVDLTVTPLEQAVDLLLEWADENDTCMWGSDECNPQEHDQPNGWCLPCRTKWFLAEWEKNDLAQTAGQHKSTGGDE